MKTVTYILPSHWASYLINHDASSLDAGDKLQIQDFLEAENLRSHPVSCEDSGFHWRHDATEFGALGCDCQTYTFLIPT